MSNYVVYTDGAYSAMRNQGAIAFIILKDNKCVSRFSKIINNTTNQRAEQLACIYALESIKTPSNVTIYSDSAYVVNTYNAGWKRKANLDLWNRLDKAKDKHNVTFIHVKGHSDNLYNNLCDFLATNEGKEEVGKS